MPARHWPCALQRHAGRGQVTAGTQPRTGAGINNGAGGGGYGTPGVHLVSMAIPIKLLRARWHVVQTEYGVRGTHGGLEYGVRSMYMCLYER